MNKGLFIYLYNLLKKKPQIIDTPTLTLAHMSASTKSINPETSS